MDKPNRIFVGGIPVRADKKQIIDFFSQYGKILHCKIKKNSKTGRSLGYAYLTYEDPKAIASLTNKQIEFCGRICECKQVLKKEVLEQELAKEKKKKLLVYKLDPNTTNQELKALFDSLTSISHAYVVKDTNNDLNLGYGYVVFHREEDLEEFCSRNLSVTLKGRNIIFTNKSQLPPKNKKIVSESSSNFSNSWSIPSSFKDFENAGSIEFSSESNCMNSSNISNNGKDYGYQTLMYQNGSKVSEVNSKPETCLIAPVLKTKFTGKSSKDNSDTGSLQYPIQGHLLEKRIVEGSQQASNTEQGKTGHTQTTKDSNKQEEINISLLASRFKRKKGILIDVLRACPYINDHTSNYKFNYITESMDRNLVAPHNPYFE